ncbi:PepSY-associated TM helix domain-containing protein [Sphingomonas sp. 37zxx]|uniref:PepSY-associated TM helix domain-containing protein n=1 Tax=Sphingomonas sp. 37zxx TaxID=1550073 RepID=UPI001E38ADC1|nr:PepSY-associated TM helix domain-containing protein [Sphingomonas sp. 37zxx]
MRLWHRWFGLGAGLWLALLSLTGIAIAWYDEVDTALNPDWRRAAISTARPAALQNVLDQASATLPGFTASQIQLARQPGDVHWLVGRAPLNGVAPVPVQIFADPATGAVLGWRETGALRLDRRHLMDLLYGIHTDLLLGETAAWLLGLVALLWVIDHGVGIALALPPRQQWRDAFRMAGRPGSLKRLFDWHRAKGMWAWPITMTLALTGLTLAWPEASRDLVGLASPVNERLHETMPLIGDIPTPIPIDTALANATNAPAKVHSIRLLPRQGMYAVRSFDARDVDNQGRLWTYVAMTNGQVVGSRHDAGESAGDAIFAWQYPLHSGHAAGWAGRILVSIGGIVTLLLAWSGVRLWWRRRKR